MHASCELLHQVIATTKKLRAGFFRVINKYEEAHVQSWTLIQDHAVSCAVILRSLFIAYGCHKTSFFWPLGTEKRI
jgi:hypothetical protein